MFPDRCWRLRPQDRAQSRAILSVRSRGSLAKGLTSWALTRSTHERKATSPSSPLRSLSSLKRDLPALKTPRIFSSSWAVVLPLIHSVNFGQLVFLSSLLTHTSGFLRGDVEDMVEVEEAGAWMAWKEYESDVSPHALTARPIDY